MNDIQVKIIMDMNIPLLLDEIYTEIRKFQSDRPVFKSKRCTGNVRQKRILKECNQNIGRLQNLRDIIKNISLIKAT